MYNCRTVIAICMYVEWIDKWATDIDFSYGNSNRGWCVKEVQGQKVCGAD